MPLRPTDAERGVHKRRREKELEEVLKRAEEAGFFEDCADEFEMQERAAELIPPGFHVRRFECDSLAPWWAIYWYSGG